MLRERARKSLRRRLRLAALLHLIALSQRHSSKMGLILIIAVRGQQIMAPLICEYIGLSGLIGSKLGSVRFVLRRKDKCCQQVTQYAASIDQTGAATLPSV
jgi:hypothetical protein